MYENLHSMFALPSSQGQEMDVTGSSFMLNGFFYARQIASVSSLETGTILGDLNPIFFWYHVLARRLLIAVSSYSNGALDMVPPAFLGLNNDLLAI